MKEPTLARNIRQFVDAYAAKERVGPLDRQDIGFLIDGLAFAQHPVREAMLKTTRRYDLGPRGAFILRMLAAGLRYPLELAKALSCGRSLITAELARLTDAGLIVSRPASNDRRRSELTLTPLGEATNEELREELARVIRTNLADYTPEEVRKFAVMLHAARGDPAGFRQLDQAVAGC